MKNPNDSVGEGREQSNAPVAFCEVGLARRRQDFVIVVGGGGGGDFGCYYCCR